MQNRFDGRSVLIILILTAIGLYAQTSWIQVLHGAMAGRGRFVQQTPDGGYVVVGSDEAEETHSDVWMIKLDTHGSVEWESFMPGHAEDTGECVRITSGGYAVLAGTDSQGDGDMDFWLIKTDGGGNPLWDETYGTSRREQPFSMCVTPDGGYIMAGSGDHNGHQDVWLVKADSKGDKKWSKYFGGDNDDDVAYCVALTDDGGFILTGITFTDDAGKGDAWLIKTSSSGKKEWDRKFGGTEADRCGSVQQTSDGGYILAGSTRSSGAGNYDAWLIKTDKNGNEQWNHTYGGKPERQRGFCGADR
jgi:hypothetical protein